MINKTITFTEGDIAQRLLIVLSQHGAIVSRNTANVLVVQAEEDSVWTNTGLTESHPKVVSIVDN